MATAHREASERFNSRGPMAPLRRVIAHGNEHCVAAGVSAEGSTTEKVPEMRGKWNWRPHGETKSASRKFQYLQVLLDRSAPIVYQWG